MATIAELNIRLGLIAKGFDRDLKRVEYQLDRSARKFSQVGSDLSSAITIPLLGLGAAAVKSAGDMESLRLALTSTMEDAGRSTQEATLELDALRKAALAPGLDFEQAVKGSIRLQNVGFAAEDARGILVQLANAIALTGGTAQELDGVTRQFAQMISKGRILQEDLTIIQENMPAISKAMDQAFGTRSADQLRALGVTAEDFIKGVTDQFTKLPRVAGGIKNSIVNLFVGLKLEASRFGEEINKAFNISDASTTLLNSIHSLVDGFASLSDGTKRFIVQMGLGVAAIGPFFKVLSAIQGVRARVSGALSAIAGSVNTASVAFDNFGKRARAVQVIQSGIQAATSGTSAATQGLSLAFASNTKAAEINRRAGRELAKTLNGASATSINAAQSFNGITGAVQRVTAAFTALNNAQRAFVVIGIVAAIGAIVYAISQWNKELSATEKAQQSVEKITKEAASSIASERVAAQELVGIIKDQTATREEQKKALEALQRIAPEHFKNLDLEKLKVGQIDQALDSYIDSLLRAAKAKSAFARLEEIQKLRDTLFETAEPSIWQRLKNSILSAGNGIVYAGLQANSQVSNFVKLRDELDAEEKAMREVIKANGDFVGTVTGTSAGAKNTGAAFGKSAEAAAEAKKHAELYANALKSIQAVATKGDVLGADVFSEQAKEIETQIERLLENGFKPYGKEIVSLRDMLKNLFAGIDVKSQIQRIQEQVQEKLLGDVDLSANVKLKIKTEGVKFDLPQLPTIEIPASVASVELPGADKAIQQAKDLASSVTGAASSYQDFANRMSESAAALEPVAAIQQMLKEGVITWEEAWQKLGETTGTSAGLMVSVVDALGSAIVQTSEDGKASMADLAGAILKEARRAIGAWIRMAVTRAVASAVESAPYPLNLVLGPLAGVAAQGIFNAVLSGIKVPAFAQGAVVDQPTLAMFGEYPGAKTNPEITTPERKMTDVFSSVLKRFFQNPISAPVAISPQTVGISNTIELQSSRILAALSPKTEVPYILSTNVAGADLQIILERAQRKSIRTRGS